MPSATPEISAEPVEYAMPAVAIGSKNGVVARNKGSINRRTSGCSTSARRLQKAATTDGHTCLKARYLSRMRQWAIASVRAGNRAWVKWIKAVRSYTHQLGDPFQLSKKESCCRKQMLSRARR